MVLGACYRMSGSKTGMGLAGSGGGEGSRAQPRPRSPASAVAPSLAGLVYYLPVRILILLVYSPPTPIFITRYACLLAPDFATEGGGFTGEVAVTLTAKPGMLLRAAPY
eukprot:602978-Rhodomonas_salina.2